MQANHNYQDPICLQSIPISVIWTNATPTTTSTSRHHQTSRQGTGTWALVNFEFLVR